MKFLATLSVRNYTISRNKTVRGFTLLELLIYMVILSGLMVIVANSFISLSKGRGQSEARSEVHAAIRFASERIRQDIKGASVVITPVSGTSSTTLQMTVSGTTVTYDVLAGQLRRKVDAASPVAVTGTGIAVTALTFTRQENYNSVLLATTTAIGIAMTLRYNASSTDWSYSDSIRTTVSLR